MKGDASRERVDENRRRSSGGDTLSSAPSRASATSFGNDAFPVHGTSPPGAWPAGSPRRPAGGRLRLPQEPRGRWEGGFEPFGRDWLEGRPDGAQESGVFLRFPGQ